MRYLFILFLLFGCGYKPSSVYQKKVIGNKIYVEVNIDVKNPSNSIFLKDSINQLIISNLNSEIVDKESANSVMKFAVLSTKLGVIEYDDNGYPILYRATSKIKSVIKIIGKDKNRTYKINGIGSYDFSVNPNSVIGDDVKNNAIKESLLKALDDIFNKISIEGMKQKEIR